MEQNNPARIVHVGLSVADLEASIRWYADVFGFREVLREHLAHIRTEMVLLDNGACQLELFRYPDSVPPPPERRHPDQDLQLQGTKHLCLLTDDLDATLVFLRRYDGTEPIIGPGRIGRFRFCYIRDNSGIPLELQQLAPDAEA